MEEIKTVSRELKYSNKWMKVYEDSIIRTNGKKGIYGIVEKGDFCLIVPVEDGCFWLVEQYRYPVKERRLEFPQGSWEFEKIDPLELAKAELKEETGITADSIQEAGWFYLAYGYSPQKCHVFIAEGLHHGKQELEEEENGLTCKKIPFDEFHRMIAGNKIADSSTLAAVTLLKTKNMLP